MINQRFHMGLPTEKLSQEEMTLLFKGVRSGDTACREKIIVYNLRLVAFLAWRYIRLNLEYDDLFSVGAIGLIKAVDTYDIDQGRPFSVYANRCIANEMLTLRRLESQQVRYEFFDDVFPLGLEFSEYADMTSGEDDILDGIIRDEKRGAGG